MATTVPAARPLVASVLIAELERIGYTHAVWLPDTETAQIWDAFQRSKLTIIQTCREGENVPIALGLLATGKRPVVMIQNTGLMESGDSIRGLALDMQQPLVLLIGYRGYAGGGPMKDSAGTYLEPIVRAWGIPYEIVDDASKIGAIGRAQALAEQRSGPVAVLLARVGE